MAMTQKTEQSALYQSVKNASFVVEDIKRKVSLIESRLSRGDSLIGDLRAAEADDKDNRPGMSSFLTSGRQLEQHSTAIGSMQDVHAENILLPQMNFTSANFFTNKSNTQMEDWRMRSMSSGDGNGPAQTGFLSARGPPKTKGAINLMN